RKDTYNFDYLPTSSHTVKVRLFNYNYFDSNPFQTTFPLYARTFDRPNQTGSVNWIWTINPTMVNEFSVTASKHKVRIGPDTSTGLADRAKYGINYPFAFPTNKDLPFKLPALAIANFSGYTGSPYPSSSAGPIYDIADNMTKIHGNHTIKFGFQWERQ